MKITYSDSPQAPEEQNVISGDLISMSLGACNNYLFMVVNSESIILIHSTDTLSYLTAHNCWYEHFKKGNFTLLARAGDWHIHVDKRAGQ